MPADVTVICEAKVQAAILDKMLARATIFAVGHPMTKMDRTQMEQVFWSNIEKEVAARCAQPAAELLLDVGFVFGAPLDDAVFMVTGTRSNPQRLQRTFQVAHAPKDGCELMIDFYLHLTLPA